MLILPISPQEAQSITTWARLDRLTSAAPDEALQAFAQRLAEAVHREYLAAGILIDPEVEIGVQQAAMPPAAPPVLRRPDGKFPARTCLTPGCGIRASGRGLCSACYQNTRTQVRFGKTTWEAMEAEGKAALRMLRMHPLDERLGDDGE